VTKKRQELCAELITRLKKRKENLALAESCTGGMVGEWLTDIAGASEVFEGGFVVYSNDSKIKLLGVPKRILASQGAVSEACAHYLAKNAREHLQTDWALSITGIAGPGGGSSTKPVGLVCFGLASASGVLTQVRHFAPKNRARVREAAALFALHWLLRVL